MPIPNHKQIFLALLADYVWRPNTFHHLHCYHPGVLCELPQLLIPEYWNSLTGVPILLSLHSPLSTQLLQWSFLNVQKVKSFIAHNSAITSHCKAKILYKSRKALHNLSCSLPLLPLWTHLQLLFLVHRPQATLAFLLFLELVIHASIFHANNSNLCKFTFSVRLTRTILLIIATCAWPSCPLSIMILLCATFFSVEFIIQHSNLLIMFIACPLLLECKHWHPVTL